ncbi:MAG: tryptophan synthase subunit alpha [Candidatus Brocadiaceae bacterium]|nr:tryptophan synthase subunit alpha [Candidatus Brocadiaceae bacterium]
MNRIDARFESLRTAARKAFIPFLTAGDPDPDATVRLLEGAEAAGADLIELGFPYSDPIADGPTIQDSYHRVLQGGQDVAAVFEMVRRARHACRLPIVAMASYSLVFRMGFERFVDRCLQAGIDGATVPDLPVDEADTLFPAARERGFRLICFTAPSTVGHRRAMVARHAAGFIYYIAVRGTTGTRDTLPPDLFRNLAELKALTPVPVAVGFGISTPEQAREVSAAADGVIVGSAIVRLIAQAHARGDDPAAAALDLIARMASAVKPGP